MSLDEVTMIEKDIKGRGDTLAKLDDPEPNGGGASVDKKGQMRTGE